MKATPQMLESYKKWYLSQGHTLVSTKEYYNNIRRYLGDGKEVTQRTVDSFRKNAMRCTTAGALKSFFRYLVRHHEFPDDILNIRFDKNVTKRRFPKSITYKEVTMIVNNMPTFKDKVLTIFIFELGLRISEGLKVKWEDFNWAEWIDNKGDYGKVTLKNTKRGKFRVLPVKPQLMKLIYEVAQKSENNIPIGNLVFDYGVENYIHRKDKTNEENLYDYLHTAGCSYREKIYKISSEKINRRISPHWLRHSKAQMLMDNDMPIESLKIFLGHERISTTELYAQASPEKVKRDLKAYDIFKKT